MRTIIELLCRPFHLTGWIPVWNRSVILTCPLAWLTSRSPRFARWFWLEP